MKISKSKQELARIISENGGWRGAANIALFGKVYGRCYMLKTDEWPEYDVTIKGFYINARDVVSDFHASPFTNWHQTILSREEYFHLYPSPDADGWIEWSGGKCPVEVGTIVDVKQRDGDFGTYLHAGKKTSEPQSKGVATAEDWSHLGEGGDIIAYRLHKPEQSMASKDIKVTPYGDSTITIGGDPMTAMRRMQGSLVFDTEPTIEQLAADYRTAKDCAERKQQEADDAKADVGAKLKALKLAGKELGLLVSPITEKQDPEMVIAVKVGDQVGCVESNIMRGKYNGMVGRLHFIDESDTSTPYLVDFGEAKIWCREVKFIRRP